MEVYQYHIMQEVVKLQGTLLMPQWCSAQSAPITSASAWYASLRARKVTPNPTLQLLAEQTLHRPKGPGKEKAPAHRGTSTSAPDLPRKQGTEQCDQKGSDSDVPYFFHGRSQSTSYCHQKKIKGWGFLLPRLLPIIAPHQVGLLPHTCGAFAPPPCCLPGGNRHPLWGNKSPPSFFKYLNCNISRPKPYCPTTVMFIAPCLLFLPFVMHSPGRDPKTWEV